MLYTIGTAHIIRFIISAENVGKKNEPFLRETKNTAESQIKS
jgi:hypothetical protein